MQKSVLKIVALILIVVLNWSGLSAMGNTLAHFSDGEESKNNSYQAEILNFHLYSSTSNFIPPETASGMTPGDSVTREISVIKDGDSFQYNAQTVRTDGNDGFCNGLNLEAKLDGVIKYSGGLMDFDLIPPIVINDDGQDDWLFTVTMPGGTHIPTGEICQIKFVFDGWQVNFSDSSSGFSDTEEIASSFTSADGGIKINKVYYDVDSEHGSEYDNEWVEIYNPLDSPVDISGWEICDNYFCDTIPMSDPIPAQGFAIITGDSTTWGYWNIPNEVVKIVLDDSRIGNGLANTSDRVILKMPSGTEDDAMSYGTDNYAFDPPCPDIAEGHMLGRVPAGYDTDLASDFKDLDLPQVSVVDMVGPGRRYCGWCNHVQIPGGHPYCAPILFYNQFVMLEWDATNLNGPDSDLSIDIIFITDSDCNGTVSSNDNTYLIADDIANTGSFPWNVRPYFFGFVWIKIIATGSENFIISNYAITNPAFEPLLSEVGDSCSGSENCCGGCGFCSGSGGYFEPETVPEETEEEPEREANNENTTCDSCDNYSEEEIINNNTNDESASEETTTNTDEETIVEETTDENSPEEEVVNEEISEEADGEEIIIEDSVDETVSIEEENLTEEENISEETTDETIIDETGEEAIEETNSEPATPEQETPVDEETPIVEEPVAVTDDTPSLQETDTENSSEGEGSDSDNTGDSSGESDGDSTGDNTSE